MADEAKRVQVSMSKELRDLLRDWAAEMSKAKDEDFGTGTVAALLLEKITARPDLAYDLLFEQKTNGQGETGKHAPRQSAPKAKGRKDAA